ncbi:MAG: hypothetical protein M1823_004122 [Watsoniomyces obsoletus]|nr:MAG: hypothetical protein M1823_004122 [Watsoniomyces obsoletus]
MATTTTDTPRRAWVTLLTRPSYLPGVVILNYTLRRHHSRYPLIVLVTDTFPSECIDILISSSPTPSTDNHTPSDDHKPSDLIIKQVDHLLPKQPVHIVADRFADTWTKLQAFSLIDWDTLVFLDADVMIMHDSIDDIFNISLPSSEWLGSTHACVCNIDHDPWAEPEWNTTNCPMTPQKHPEALSHGLRISPESPKTHHLMNSGVFLFHPSAELWERILNFLNTTPKIKEFTFPDQNFLDEFFKNRWIALPWVWNALKTHVYWHRNVWVRNEDVRILHYIVDKPWSERIKEDGKAGYLRRDGTTHGWWWMVYEEWKKEVLDKKGDEGRRAVEGLEKFVAEPLKEDGGGDEEGK